MRISEVVAKATNIAKSKGWSDPNQNKAEQIALMHSELSEALEALRKPDRKDDHLPHLDPVGVELADTFIRIAHYCGKYGIDLERCVVEKLAYNAGRPYQHDGKKF